MTDLKILGLKIHKLKNRNAAWAKHVCFSVVWWWGVIASLLLTMSYSPLKHLLWFLLHRLFQKFALNRMKWTSWWRRSLWGAALRTFPVYLTRTVLAAIYFSWHIYSANASFCIGHTNQTWSFLYIGFLISLLDLFS